MSRGMTSKGVPEMCDNCTFFSESTNEKDIEHGVGFCHRFPHVERKQHVDWCGEHEETDSDEDVTMEAIASILGKARMVPVSEDEGEQHGL